MYLHRGIDGYGMAGALNARAFKTDRLRRFGYAELTARRGNLLCAAGESIRAHEFHYYDSTDCGDGFSARKPFSSREWGCVHAAETLYAGFPHLFLPANPCFAENFIRKAAGRG
jgi:cobyrinic acid a,c-diamide synthase